MRLVTYRSLSLQVIEEKVFSKDWGKKTKVQRQLVLL